MISNCYICNTQVNRPKSQMTAKNIFCSRNCYSVHLSHRWEGKNNPLWKGGFKEYNCDYCEKEIIRRATIYRGGDKRYCSVKCAAKDRGRNNLKEKHWNWKGGGKTATPIRATANYEKWRLSVFLRDNFKCVDCNSDIDLHAHHIESLATQVKEYKKQFGKLNVYDDYFYDINNGLTLCKKCHRKIHKQ